MSYAADLVITIVIILVVSFSSIFGYVLYTELQEDMLDTPMFNDSTAPREALIGGEVVIDMYDEILLGVVVAMILGMLLLAVFLNTHPAFIVAMILILIFVVILSASFSNMYEDISGHDQFSDAASNFPMQNYIMDNLPLIMAVIGILIIIVLLAKIPRASGGGVA